MASYLLFPEAKAQQTDWKLFNETDEIKIYTATVGCKDEVNGTHIEYNVFRFLNASNQPKTLNFEIETYFNGKLHKGDAKFVTIELPASGEVFSSCKTSGDVPRIFSSMLDNSSKTKLTNFQFKNIKVN